MVALEDITVVTINGQTLAVDGYLDVGLWDTMADLFVNFLGAVVLSVLGFVYAKQRGKGRTGWLMDHLLPVPEEEENRVKATEQEG